VIRADGSRRQAALGSNGIIRLTRQQTCFDLGSFQRLGLSG
jgi:hypothetical protein